MKNTFKSGFVAIIGRPNVGKSTLLNQILGQKIVITTNKPQTTRKRIKGILTTDKGQIIFIDTPGIHKPLNKLGQFLLDEAKIAVPDADLILFLVDASEPAGKGDKWIAENILSQTKIPVILVLNKIDKTNFEKIKENLKTYQNAFIHLFNSSAPLTVQLSAITGKNKEQLIDTILSMLPKGEKLYDDETITEETMRDIAGEIVREKILINTKEEIPHSIEVKIENYEETEKLDRIFANIYCESQSQKGILIGKGGSLLKIIGTQARLELEQISEKKIYLALNVKVEKNWRKKEQILKKFGYKN